jgi:hypothetical protein
MVVNFKIHKINRNICKLTQTLTLIKNKKKQEFYNLRNILATT